MSQRWRDERPGRGRAVVLAALLLPWFVDSLRVAARRLRRFAIDLWRGDVGFRLGLRYAEQRAAERRRESASTPAPKGRVR